jgi:SAM-dependent methyltransferase
MSELPYFDLLLEGRRYGDPAAALFERHVHWGYWDERPATRLTPQAYQAAMARLDDEVLAGARLADGMKIADVGCGFGGTLARLSERYPAARLVGVNFDMRQLQVAVPSRAAFLRADACSLPLRSAAFDAILAVECIFHFPSRLAFLKEASRVLKPGGRVALSDFVPASAGASGGALGRKIEALIARAYGKTGDSWKDGGYERMAAAAGLVVEQDRDVTRQTLPTYPFLLSQIKARSFGPGERLMLWPTRLLYWLSALGVVRYRIVSFRKP